MLKEIKPNYILRTIFFFLVVIGIYFFNIHTTSIPQASAKQSTNEQPEKKCKKEKEVVVNGFNKELKYSFKVANKLNGIGRINLSIDDNQIKGFANGLGNTQRCKVDFESNFKGKLNTKNGSISVNLNGIADPIRIPLPGKVTFEGPLTGSIEENSILLKGIVNVDGVLAATGGFNKKEEVLVEITDDMLSSSFQKLKLNIANANLN